MNPLKMRSNQTSGYLFTFCGLDGCGKSTMLNRLSKELGQRYETLKTKQPTDVVRKSKIFRTFTDAPNHGAYEYRSLSLFAAGDRVQHTNKVILPAMEEGKIVISDRYFYSCLANLRARGYTQDHWIYEIAESIIQPDIAFFFDVPVDLAIARVRNRPNERNRYINVQFQEQLDLEYRSICKANNGVMISTACSEEESYQAVKTAVERVLTT